MYKKLALTIFAVLALANVTFSQEFKNEFGFKSDNDSYLGLKQDRYYTNGLFIYFRRAIDQQKLKGNLEKVTYEISAGQKIYNAISGYSPDPAKHDRPFAGYLYGGVQVSFFSNKESLLKVGLDLGTIGPDALGKDAQVFLHKTVGFYDVEGWDYEIANQLSANANVQFAKLLHRSEDKSIDFTLDTYANLGTTYNGAGLGVVFRAGNVNQLFNSAHYNASIGNKSKTNKIQRKEVYFYAKPQLNFVAYDATVQGSLFNNNSPITFGVKPIVFAQTLGFKYSSPRFTFDYSLVFQTKEIKSTAKPHQYGSISMFYRFN